MRKLNFELVTSVAVKNIWPVMTDINNYHQYIKYCLSSKLVGNFKEGSSWYDWSTVVYLPLRINHKIIKIIPNNKIVYLIKFPFGEIWQTVSIFDGKETKVKLEVIIDFPSRMVDKTLGNLVYLRNRKMLEATVENYKKSFSK